MLTKIHINRFKRLENIEIDLSESVVFEIGRASCRERV